jgi:copper chaperone CopZ
VAVEALEVESVETDMNANTLSVVFDDSSISIEDVVTALADAGYAVPSYSPVD